MNFYLKNIIFTENCTRMDTRTISLNNNPPMELHEIATAGASGDTHIAWQKHTFIYTHNTLKKCLERPGNTCLVFRPYRFIKKFLTAEKIVLFVVNVLLSAPRGRV